MSTVPEPTPEMPLAGVRVVITRAERDGDPLRQRLEGLGAEVFHLPTIAIEPPVDWSGVDAALSRLPDYHYVVFTSRNAVEAVIGRLSQLGLGDTIPPGPEVVAAGEVTASLLHSLGVDTLTRPDVQSTRGVVAAILSDDVRGKTVFYPTSDLARPHLRQQLEEAGARVDQVVAYRTVRPSEADTEILDALRQGRVDVLTVSSPSSVQNLVAILYPEQHCLRLTRLVCIGRTTAGAAREEGLDPMAVAREPSIDGLVEAIGRAMSYEP
jgi:uroporphyrinogen-III synthase